MAEPSASHARDLRGEVLRPVAERYPGKDELVELIALAFCAGENLLVVGPPGTAKSELVGELASRLGGRYFEYLLTRFTEPSEIFGPVDIAELREGRLVTRTEGMLPEAEIVFLDEIFNAGSAILNTLLGIINDGIYRRGNERRPTPLVSVLAATNRLVDDPSLRALEDRFTLRARASALEDERVPDLLRAGWKLERQRITGVSPSPSSFGMARLRALQEAVATVDLEPLVLPLADLVRSIRATGIFLSDRRAVRLQRLAAASAVISGRSGVRVSDLWPARHVWETEDDRELIEKLVDDFIAEREGEGARKENDHPLAVRGRRPVDLLEAVALLEAEIGGLRERLPREAADSIHSKLSDLDREARWLRARGAEDEESLRKLETRLDSLSAALARKGDEP